jgi:DNA-directed RNA polymerases I, II, and III subunit RPABC1
MRRRALLLSSLEWPSDSACRLLGILEEKSIQRGIIVFPGNMTSAARKVITAMSAQYKLEEFSEADLLVNITHHTLVPRHEVLSPENKKDLLEK